jgi:hypothetical protein
MTTICPKCKTQIEFSYFSRAEKMRGKYTLQHGHEDDYIADQDPQYEYFCLECMETLVGWEDAVEGFLKRQSVGVTK